MKRNHLPNEAKATSLSDVQKAFYHHVAVMQSQMETVRYLLDVEPVPSSQQQPDDPATSICVW
jgi:hypothetical protein